jgi:hypothetical protein
MDRRAFLGTLAGGLVAAPLAAEGAADEEIPAALLSHVRPGDRAVPAAASLPSSRAFKTSAI